MLKDLMAKGGFRAGGNYSIGQSSGYEPSKEYSVDFI